MCLEQNLLSPVPAEKQKISLHDLNGIFPLVERKKQLDGTIQINSVAETEMFRFDTGYFLQCSMSLTNVP